MNILVNLLKTSFLLFIFACSSTTQNRAVSKIDADYKIKKFYSNKSSSFGISFYQKTLRKAWGSHCKWYPHDSKNAQILNEKCGPLKTSVKSFARFLNEANSARHGHDLIITKGKVYFENLPNSCDLFF